jgi:hypothetical protein
VRWRAYAHRNSHVRQRTDDTGNEGQDQTTTWRRRLRLIVCYRIFYGAVILLLGLSACVANRGREHLFEHNQDDHHHTVQQAGGGEPPTLINPAQVHSIRWPSVAGSSVRYRTDLSFIAL